MSLADVLDPLRQPLVTVLDTPVSWTEVLGFGSGALCVRLVARQHLANWPIGIANNLFFILLFTQSGLYADAGLQIVFIALAAYGWWTWTHGGGPGTDGLPVRSTTRAEWVLLLAAGVVGTLALTVLLDRATDSTVPFWDALTTALSLAATYGQCRKLVESWWLWIAADVVYIPLYAYKELYLTSLLYAGFLTLCLIGLRNWRRDLTSDRPVPAEVVA
ncbi:Nicotinamide riboside transporter PnuC [Streptomyces sp. ADI92-24]|uniref:nicotinamide riboside transporter PnuC n=1 Tax=unclassified Streptomyces TaxID=2593676 RepID=UPI000F4AB205|nr:MULTISPECIES: nicotinamide riboside transporter PnuC [unclassified Streptomyces]MCX4773496.1 nicotinamide riboside transporter PnuC [Streptomyces sp. NBC_01285]ROQ73931.1 nicotinamide mononucleotide transporter [Streptomyces sp. CEV 2-1]RPK34470.1 Nicotinamide riboside transporter PnuC [Streptomyces sp. ADI92-24]